MPDPASASKNPRRAPGHAAGEESEGKPRASPGHSLYKGFSSARASGSIRSGAGGRSHALGRGKGAAGPGRARRGGWAGLKASGAGPGRLRLSGHRGGWPDTPRGSGLKSEFTASSLVQPMLRVP